MLLLRRSFSVRENLLKKKILERDGRDALLNKVMLVQVHFHKHKKKVNTMLWGTQIPTRKGSVLSSAITAQNESVFAAVVQSSEPPYF